MNGPVVTDAPFSAEATTTVTQVLGDGTRIEQSTTARFFRDRTGRVRREQTILGLGALNTAAGNLQTITVDPDPGDGTAYTLDPMTRTARRVPRMAIVDAGFVCRADLYPGRDRRGGGAQWRTAARQQGNRGVTGHAANRRRQSRRPEDDDDHSDRADWQRPADRDHRRAVGVSGAEDAGLLAELRSPDRRRRIPVDEHQPCRAAGGSLHGPVGLHDQRTAGRRARRRAQRRTPGPVVDNPTRTID